jgi:hypothetical protein
MPGYPTRQRRLSSALFPAAAKRARRACLAAVLVSMAVLAGCIGNGDSGTGTTDGEDDWDDGAPGQGNVTGGSDPMMPPGNQTQGSGNVTWTHENRTGTVSGTALIVTGGNPQEESFLVQFGTAAIEFSVHLEGDTVQVFVAPPGCEDESCQQDISSGTFSAEAPPEGDWRVILEPQTMVGPYSTDYEIVFAQAVEGP